MIIKITFHDGVESVYEGIESVVVNSAETYLDLFVEEQDDAQHSFELNDIKSIEIIVESNQS